MPVAACPLAANLYPHLLELSFVWQLSIATCKAPHVIRMVPGPPPSWQSHMAGGYSSAAALSNKAQALTLVPPDGSPCSNSSSRMTEKSVVVSVKLKKWFLKIIHYKGE